MRSMLYCSVFSLLFNGFLIDQSSEAMSHCLTKFSGLIDVWVQMIDLNISFLITEGILQWQPILGQNWPLPTLFPTLSFQNTLENRNIDVKRLNVDGISVSGRNLVSFCSVTLTRVLQGSTVYSTCQSVLRFVSLQVTREQHCCLPGSAMHFLVSLLFARGQHCQASHGGQAAARLDHFLCVSCFSV